MSEDKIRREVLRLNTRYLIEIVEAFDFCPWAKQVRGTPRFAREIFFAQANSAALRENVGAAIENIASQTTIDISLLIFPRLSLDFGAFRNFVSDLESAHAELHPRGQLPLAMASFHPGVEADLNSPARLVPFIRRSPDPTIQLVRQDVMAKVNGNSSSGTGSVFADNLESFLPLLGKTPTLSLSDKIAKTNMETVERVTIDHIETILTDIAEDRKRSYRELFPT